MRTFAFAVIAATALATRLQVAVKEEAMSMDDLDDVQLIISSVGDEERKITNEAI